MILLFLWIHWAWKWTQARLLVKKYWFELFESSHILRNVSAEDTDIWRLVKKCMVDGKFVPIEIMSSILDSILENNHGKNIILDWFLRTLEMKEMVLQKIPNNTIIVFNISYSLAVSRLEWRMYDKITGETFSKWIKINPSNGNILIQKNYDTDHSKIISRLNLYMRESMVVEESLKRSAVKYFGINAEKSTDEVFKEIQGKIGIEKK